MLLVQDPRYQEGARCYSQHQFFEAHEHWEELWKTLQGPERDLLQGLIQVAAAWVKWQRDEPRGMCRLLENALRRWQTLSSPCSGVDLQRLRARVTACLSAAEAWESGEREGVSLQMLPQLL